MMSHPCCACRKALFSIRQRLITVCSEYTQQTCHLPAAYSLQRVLLTTSSPCINPIRRTQSLTNKGLLNFPARNVNSTRWYDPFPTRMTHVRSGTSPRLWRHACSASQAEYKPLSALYVGNLEQARVAVLEVDLDIEGRLADVKKLQENVKARGMNLDISQLAAKHQQLLELKQEKASLEQQRNKITTAMKILVKSRQGTSGLADKKNKLIFQGKDLRERLKLLNKYYFELEREVMLLALQLPTDLHHSTPREDTVLKEYGLRSTSDRAKDSHISIGAKETNIIFSNGSPGAYYLRGDAAVLEHRLNTWVLSWLQGSGLQPLTVPDMFKAIVVEGCGEDLHKPLSVFTIHNAEAVETEPSEVEAETDGGGAGTDAGLDSRLYLAGVTPMAFAAYLTKMNIKEGSLPLKLFAAGRRYQAHQVDSVKTHGLFAAPQATVVELFAGVKDDVEADQMGSEFTEVIHGVYSRLGIPYRLVQVGTGRLKQQEATCVEIQVWSPGLNNYIKVGQLSQWQDYISRRLIIKYARETENVAGRNYIHTVHCTLMSVPAIVAALIENHQSSARGRAMWELLKHFETTHC